MSPFAFSAFADESGPDLDTQLGALVSAQIEGLDVRSVDEVNVLNLTDAKLREVYLGCMSRGIHVQCVGSPVNKVEYSKENRPREVEKLRRAIHAAHELHTNRIRLFTPAADWSDRNGVVDWIKEMVAMAEEANFLLIHENDGRYFGAFPAQEKWLFEQIESSDFKAAFDFSNAVMIGFDPVDDFLPWILPHLDTLHMKDFAKGSNQVVACGEGDGRILEFLRSVIDSGWKGTLTLEPHLQLAGAMGGFSGPELFGQAASKMKDIASAAWRS